MGFRFRNKSLHGLTLVEMVVVILLLGVIAAVAAPKMFDAATDARTNSTKQNLAVIRDALELYKANNGSYPAANSLHTALADYIRGPFPAPQVGSGAGNSAVKKSVKDPIDKAAGGQGWIYNESTGEFRVNDDAYLTW